MPRGEALMNALGGGVPTGKVDPMTKIDPQADPNPDPDPDPNPDPDPDPDEESLEEIKAERDRLKAQAARGRTAAARAAKAEADAARKAAKDSDDVETIKAQLAAAEKSNTDLAAKLQRNAARTIAAEAGAVDAAVVARLVDFDSLTDPTDEDELKEVIGDLLREKPYLKGGKVKTDAGASGGGKHEVSTDLNAVIRRGRGGG